MSLLNEYHRDMIVGQSCGMERRTTGVKGFPMDELHEKKAKLDEYLGRLGRVAVAFSSGVDSTLLLKVAHDLLGDDAIAVTAAAGSFPAREQQESEDFCGAEGIRQIVVHADVMAIKGFRENPPDRCYLCKKELFTKLIKAAGEAGFTNIVEGSNKDDESDYRPGLKAIAELQVKSPLRELGFTKADIRALSKELGLPTWRKQSFACLATRFVYGEPITEERLKMVDKAEQRLIDLGFEQVRVRIHGDLARIEVNPADMPRIAEPETAKALNDYFHELGFLYTSLDLGGYKMGSMNKSILGGEL